MIFLSSSLSIHAGERDGGHCRLPPVSGGARLYPIGCGRTQPARGASGVNQALLKARRILLDICCKERIAALFSPCSARPRRADWLRCRGSCVVAAGPNRTCSYLLQIIVETGCQSRQDIAENIAELPQFPVPLCAVRHAPEIGVESEQCPYPKRVSQT